MIKVANIIKKTIKERESARRRRWKDMKERLRLMEESKRTIGKYLEAKSNKLKQNQSCNVDKRMKTEETLSLRRYKNIPETAKGRSIKQDYDKKLFKMPSTFKQTLK